MPQSGNIKRKQYVTTCAVDTDERTVTAVINTASIDRDGEIVLPRGMDSTGFEKNPVVQWAHNYIEPPIGKALWLKPGRKQITGKVRFAMEDENPFAEQVYRLFKGGYLNAFSIAFIEHDGHAPTPDEIKSAPEWAEAKRVIDKWELLEFSAVPVPANAEALAYAVKSKTVDVTEDMAKQLEVDKLIEEYESLDKGTRPDAAKSVCKERDGAFEAAKGPSKIQVVRPVPVIQKIHDIQEIDDLTAFNRKQIHDLLRGKGAMYSS